MTTEEECSADSLEKLSLEAKAKLRLEEMSAKSCRMFAGYAAPFLFKGVEYQIDEGDFAEAEAIEGVRRMPIWI